MWNVRYVMEGPLQVSVRAFLLPDDVLCMRSTASKWNSTVVQAFCLALLYPFEER